MNTGPRSLGGLRPLLGSFLIIAFLGQQFALPLHLALEDHMIGAIHALPDEQGLIDPAPARSGHAHDGSGRHAHRHPHVHAVGHGHSHSHRHDAPRADSSTPGELNDAGSGAENAHPAHPAGDHHADADPTSTTRRGESDSSGAGILPAPAAVAERTPLDRTSWTPVAIRDPDPLPTLLAHAPRGPPDSIR